MGRTLSIVCLILCESGTPEDALRAEDFARADASREFAFPRDHGDHPAFKTEWWYVTGSVTDDAGNLYGYQATWFRSALVPAAQPREASLAARDLFFFHGALTDVSKGTFAYSHRAARGAPAWAGARDNPAAVRIYSDTLESTADGRFQLRFRVGTKQLELSLRPQRSPLLHGTSPGLSQKGASPGQASYYYSMTRLETSGTITSSDAPPQAVRGQSWWDHEFGSNQLGEAQAGWDWFSAAFDDGHDLMIYLLRRKDGTIEPASSGTLRLPDGRRVHLKQQDFRVEALDHWQSPHNRATYPSRWRLRVPEYELECTLRPLVADQEMRTDGTTGISYWEGLCEWQGQIGGNPVTARGYVELVGYAGAFLAEI